MRRALLLPLCVVTVLTATTSMLASWDDYRPRTLQSIIDLHAPMIEEANKENVSLLLTGDNFPSKVKLTYLGKSRQLDEKRREVVDAERKSIPDRFPPGLAEIFGTEMLFKEGEAEYWIPVQKPLLEYLPKEVHVGDAFTAYVIWLGAIKSEGKWEWVFAMNEFDAPVPAEHK